MESQNRYTRQINLAEIGDYGQSRLYQAKVLIVGMGGLGCPATLYLAAGGVGILGLLDYDLVDESNLNRQILFCESDIGVPKVLAARTRLQQHNSQLNIICHKEKLTEYNTVALFKGYDLIVDGTDNFQSKYLINECLFID